MNINNLYNRLAYMKKMYPSKYELYVKEEGKCADCRTSVDTTVRKRDKKDVVLCRSCYVIWRERTRMGMSVHAYKEATEEIIQETIDRVEGEYKSRKNINKKDINRDMEIYNLHLKGRTHAHIGEMYGLSRERVRQIITKLKKL